MGWMIILILVVLILFFARAKHMRNKFYLILIIALIIFVYATASRILEGQNLKLSSAADIAHGAKVYFSWLTSVAGNFKGIAGDATKMDWKLGGNSTT